MRRALFALGFPVLASCSVEDEPSEEPERTAVVVQAYGEPQNGFPSWYERMIHVMVNRSRADPAADLAGCSSCGEAACYMGARNPVEWYYDHARAARFHATNLTSASCGMMHPSPCTLVAGIGTLYPSPCDGTIGCACQGGTAPCTGGTAWNTRLSAFGVTGSIAENIAGMGDPKAIFYQWLWEPTASTSCAWSVQNGHRYNILNGAYRRLGVGGYGGYTVQDFSGQGTLTQKIPSGAHYPLTGTNLEMRAAWYSTVAAQTAYVNIDGVCTTMSLERGSAMNGTYLANVAVASGCREYYFIIKDQAAGTFTYPNTGSFGVSCAANWSAIRPPEGAGCPNPAACGNGMLDAGETCDPPASCPATCNDGNACTTDAMSGAAATCNLACTHTPIAACINGDSCCASGCTANNDTDCSASCGNGAVEMGETCDPPASCPATCDDGNACTQNGMTGSAATCNLSCTQTPITGCTGGDGCCASGCTANDDTDCSASCNNGTVEPGETCDPPGTCPATCNDGNACTIDTLTGSAATCNVACGAALVSTCAGGDGCCPAGCDANSDPDCSATCGNGSVEMGETCDPPSGCVTSCDDANACTIDALTGSAQNCNASCASTTIVACAAGDACCPAGCDPSGDSDCSTTCGNGTVEAGETCDPISTCPATCDDNDACTVDSETGSAANCNTTCGHTSVVACQAGDGCCPAGCTEASDGDCAFVCGNGVVDAGETCDPPGSCPTECDDGDVCTGDTLTGDPDSCTSECKQMAITACVGGDGCCPSACAGDVDSDCDPGTSGGGAGEDDGAGDGCSCESAPSDGPGGAWGFALLGIGIAARCRRRHSGRRSPNFLS